MSEEVREEREEQGGFSRDTDLSEKELNKRCDLAMGAARRHIRQKEGYFATFLSKLDFHKTTDLPTAGVDELGNLYYNPEFVGSLGSSQKDCADRTLGLILHEIMHIRLKGIELQKDHHDPKLWNIAQDTLINNALLDKGYKLPECGVLPENDEFTFNLMIDDYTVEDISDKNFDTIYKELSDIMDELKDQLPDEFFDMPPQQGQPQDQQGDSQGDGQSQDQDDAQDGQGEGQGESGGEEEAEDGQGGGGEGDEEKDGEEEGDGQGSGDGDEDGQGGSGEDDGLEDVSEREQGQRSQSKRDQIIDEMPDGFDDHIQRDENSDNEAGSDGGQGEGGGNSGEGDSVIDETADKEQPDWNKVERSAARSAGSKPGILEEQVEKARAKRVVNWKEFVQEKLENIMRGTGRPDFSYPDLPHLEQGGVGGRIPEQKKKEFTIAAAIDVSGSMGRDELQFIVAQLDGLFDSMGGQADVDLKVIQYDVGVKRGDDGKVDVQEFDEGVDAIDSKGGGGTDHSKLFNYINGEGKDELLEGRHRELNLVLFTDAWDNIPEEEPDDTNLIWIVTDPQQELDNIPCGEHKTKVNINEAMRQKQSS